LFLVFEIGVFEDLIVYNPIIVNDAAVFAFFTGEYSDKALFF
jgi:hypothetical protein